jgi:hypothetical protein
LAKLNFQFHAIEDEIIQVIKESVNRYDLFLVGLQLFPEFSCQLICKDIFDEQMDFIKNSRMLMLFNYKPDLSQNDYNHFVKTNKECLIFEIGGQKEGSLKESSISTITDDVETMKIWKTIIKEFKNDMVKGAWAVNPMNGAKVYYKHHQYTEGAKKLFEDGIKLIPVAGWNYYVLSE